MLTQSVNGPTRSNLGIGAAGLLQGTVHRECSGAAGLLQGGPGMQLGTDPLSERGPACKCRKRAHASGQNWIPCPNLAQLRTCLTLEALAFTTVCPTGCMYTGLSKERVSGSMVYTGLAWPFIWGGALKLKGGTLDI